MPDNEKLPELNWYKQGDRYAPCGYIVREGSGDTVASLHDQQLGPILAASTKMLEALELVRDTLTEAKDAGMIHHPLRSKLNAMEQRVIAALAKAQQIHDAMNKENDDGNV